MREDRCKGKKPGEMCVKGCLATPHTHFQGDFYRFASKVSLRMAILLTNYHTNKSFQPVRTLSFGTA